MPALSPYKNSGRLSSGNTGPGAKNSIGDGKLIFWTTAPPLLELIGIATTIKEQAAPSGNAASHHVLSFLTRYVLVPFGYVVRHHRFSSMSPLHLSSRSVLGSRIWSRGISSLFTGPKQLDLQRGTMTYSKTCFSNF